MTVDRVEANGIQIAYESFGNPADPALVLIMGLGTQMIGWPEPFCRQLAQQGFYVVRFDNRDIGESTHLSDLPAPDIRAVALRRRPPAYPLEACAADTVGLLDALGLDVVHLVGASMGGFIAQLVALNAPDRVASLTLMMTSTGSRRVGQARLKLVANVLRRKPATSREEAVAATVAMFELIRSPGYPVDAAYVREIAGRSYDRGYDAAGARRQLGAAIAQRDRTRDLATITVPTVVLHGLQDPLVAPSGGLAVARAIPGSRFVGFPGMGHDLPRPLWPDFIAEIVANAHRARVG